MSAPRERITAWSEVVPGLLHASVQDDRLGFRSDCHAFESDGGWVVVDPLPGDPAELPGGVATLVLTGGFHQRAAWDWRAATGAPIWCPRDADGLEGIPDFWYDDGAALPGDLRARHAPGPTVPHVALRAHRAERALLLVADLLVRPDEGPWFFVPDEHVDEPGRVRASLRALLEEPFDVLLSCHGPPQTDGAMGAVRDALARDERLGG